MIKFKEVIKSVKALLYITNVLWSIFLIYESYKLKVNFRTIFITVIIMLSSMVMNDLLKFE